jgi:hypothetical protein
MAAALAAYAILPLTGTDLRFPSSRRNGAMQSRPSASHRAVRLGLAALLGLLVAATLTGEAFSRVIPPNSPPWLTLTPIFGAVFLPPALSLLLDAPVRRSWRVLLVALVTLALLVVGIVVMNSVFMAFINRISG